MIDANKVKMDQVIRMQSVVLASFFEARETEVYYLAQSRLVYDVYKHYTVNNPEGLATYRHDYTELNTFFTDLVKGNENLRDAFILSPQGRVMASSHVDSLWIDLSDRMYFIEAMEGKTTISNLLVDRVKGESVLFVATPVYDERGKDAPDAKPIGVMANIIDGVRASGLLRELNVMRLGEVYLIDDLGMIVFHTNKDLIGKSHEEMPLDTFFKFPKKVSDSRFFRETEQQLYVVYHSVENTPWRLVVEQENREIISSAYDALGIMLMITCIVLIVASAVIFKTAKIITSSIVNISQVMRKTTLGDLSVRSQHISNDEIGQLSADLNHMLDELTGAYQEVEAKNEELVATEEELRQNYELLYLQKIELTEAQDKFKLALEGSGAVVWEWDLVSNRFYASDLWEQVTGQPKYDEKITHVVFETLLDLYAQENLMLQFYQNWKKHQETFQYDLNYQDHNDKQKIIQIKGKTVYDLATKPIKVSGTLIDITEENQMKAKIHQLAYTNELTGLPNRTSFISDIKVIIEACETPSFYIMQFDIDNFARVNDSLGHAIGDQLLKLVAERIMSLVNKQVKVYHLSSDEYGVILLEGDTIQPLEALLECIFGLLEVPFEIEGRAFHMSMSMGITMFPTDGNTVNKLIQNVDTAMYAAKKMNRSSYVHYQVVMSENATFKIELEDLLRTAINDNRLFMVYQPQYDLKTQSFESLEALMRLRDLEGNLISPISFIPIAEETGLIIELGYWAFKQVCTVMKKWQRRGVIFKNVSINVSAVQLKQPNFAQELISILDTFDLPAHYIELEITESILIEFDEMEETVIDKLRDYGFKVALDDFGTGYSSLSYLRQLPIETLKIDKSFISNIGVSQKDRELIRQVIGLAKELNLRVIAEGVETEEQYTVLSDYQCDVIQGYYFSKPMSEKEVLDGIKST